MTHLHAERTTQRHPIPPATVVVIAFAIFVVGVIGGAGIGGCASQTHCPRFNRRQPLRPRPRSSRTRTRRPPAAVSIPHYYDAQPLTDPTDEGGGRKTGSSGLEALAADGYAAAKPRGQWVAQLSSKYIGITDPNQTARFRVATSSLQPTSSLSTRRRSRRRSDWVRP